MLSKKGFKVSLWGAFKDYTAYLDKERVNTRFLPGIRIPKDIAVSHNLDEVLRDMQLVILAVPSQHLRSVMKKIKRCRDYHRLTYLSAAKGIEMGSLKRMSEVIHEEAGNVKLAVLSGPTIAHEVAAGIPTTCVIASHDEALRKNLQSIFMTDRFRVYTNEDVIGVELGGSLKNIVAIACGISDGLGFGTNAKAALLSRGLVEISRLGAVMGAKLGTFSGISGLGDLVTTCISPYSRNRFVGEQIGKGKSLKAVIKHMRMVAEGVPTAKSAYKLAMKYKVDMPIAKEVYSVLYKNKSPLGAVRDLMARKEKEE
jgi:glycerol-3-phosphate dehydrogenase (NAD(P)+)